MLAATTSAGLDAHRAHLLARIHRHYATITDTHLIAGRLFQFTRVADPDAVLDRICAEEDHRDKLAGRRRHGDELRLPYWAELWDSALGMASLLAQREDLRALIRDRHSLLDLGCGMGFAGMVAAALGCKVLLADLEPHALLFARLNTLPWRRRVRTRRLNWQTERLDELFDFILGADVLYDRAQWQHLERFWRVHLRRGGQVLLGEPGRQTGDAFPEWITSRLWNIDRHEEPVATRTRPIRVFRLKCEA